MTIDSIVQYIGDVGMRILFFDVLFFVENQKIEFLVLFITLACLMAAVLLRFPHIRYLPDTFRIMFQKKYETDSFNGEIPSHRAFWSSMSGIVGVGNITGVCAAVCIGGPGSILWITVFGFISMPLRYAEIYFGHKMRVIENKTIVDCGPFAYVPRALSYFKSYFQTFGIRTFCIMFVVASLGAVVIQVNPMVNAIIGSNEGGTSRMICASIISIVVLYIITGGLQRIAKVAEKLAMFMSATYMFAVISVLYYCKESIPGAIALIAKEAFSPSAAYGGVITVIFYSFRRAIFASETGFGTASLLHGVSTRKSSSDEAKLGMITPFIGSLIFCSLNGLMLVVSGAFQNGTPDIEMMRSALVLLHPYMNYVLVAVILMFGLSTIITWFYYATSAMRRVSIKPLIYKVMPLIYCVIAFVSAYTTFTNLLRLSDIITLLITVPNVLAILYLVFKTRKDHI